MRGGGPTEIKRERAADADEMEKKVNGRLLYDVCPLIQTKEKVNEKNFIIKECVTMIIVERVSLFFGGFVVL